MKSLVFGAFNNSFEPARTPFDWLSRDSTEVDRYIADPRCGGFESRVQLFIDILGALPDLTRPARLARIPQTLPVYIFGGTRDPVGSNIHRLLEAYRAAGLGNVRHKFYPLGRHESVNEINRDEVTQDLIRWLDSFIVHVETPPSGAVPTR